jgi:hypothetical protein
MFVFILLEKPRPSIEEWNKKNSNKKDNIGHTSFSCLFRFLCIMVGIGSEYSSLFC